MGITKTTRSGRGLARWPYDSVSSPRHIARSVRISRTTRTCSLRIKGYVTYRVGLLSTAAVRTTIAYFTASNRRLSADAPRQFGLRPDVDPSPQFLQIDGCLYHLTPASHFAEGVMNSRAPLLHGRYPVSTLLRTQPPPSRLRPTSRGHRLYELPCSNDFSMGRGRLLQLLSVSLSPCCPYHPAGVDRRISQIATNNAAFARH